MRITPGPALQRVITGAGLVTVAAAAGAEYAHRHALEHNEEYRLLRSLPAGTPWIVTSADGTRIHAESFGPEDTGVPTFVLAPGWTEEFQVYSRVIRGLVEQGHRVVAYDLRGQGSSGLPAHGDHELARYGEDIEAVLDATCAERDNVILVGHSMGAMSIAAWAVDHDVTARVRAVALLSTGFADLIASSRLLPAVLPEGIRREIGTNYILSGSNSYPQVSTAISRAITRYAAFGPHASDAEVAFYEPMLWRCPPQVRAAAGRSIARMNLLGAVQNIPVPALVLVGTHDRLTPPNHAERIAAGLPQVTDLVVIDEIGHMATLECPERVVSELEALGRHALPSFSRVAPAGIEVLAG
ncbi:MAG: alpha/beta hydrolase [Conexibacteraceae bacterium]|nr:alpha/beta hydrolase [Conexibacteraceae bacterium]